MGITDSKIGISDLKIVCRFFVTKNSTFRFIALHAKKSATKSRKSDKNIQKSDGLFANQRSDFWPIFTHSTCAKDQETIPKTKKQ